MHLYACICMFIAASTSDHRTDCLQVRICMYMYVYDGICMYMKYMHVLCSYMHVFPGITPKDTGNDATSPKHCLKGRQSAGHTQPVTQGIPGHLTIHFFSHLANVARTQFGAPHPAARV